MMVMARSSRCLGIGLMLLIGPGAAGCGGAQVGSEGHDNPHARALEAALRNGAAVDRDLFAAPVKIEGAQDWESLSAAQADDSQVWYRVFARLYGGRLHVDEITVEQEAVDKVLRPDSKGNASKSPPTAYFGTGYTIVGLPPEFAFWLALADLYREAKVEPQAVVDRRGFGTTKHEQTSKSQARDSSSGEHSDMAATRDLVQFRVTRDVTCAGQLKRFLIDEDSYVSPADEAERRLQQEERGRRDMDDRREDMGLGGGAKGQVSWSMGREADGAWAVRIHLAHDAQQANAKGEVLDESLICRSTKPMWAQQIPGYVRQVSKADGNTWKLVLWRGGQAQAPAPAKAASRRPSAPPSRGDTRSVPSRGR